MNDDFADLESFFQAHVFPGLAAVGRFVHAVAVRGRVARVALAGADPDDVFIRRRDAYVADRHGGLAVELVLEGDAVVDGLEQPAGSGGHPVRRRVGLVDGKGGDASAHVGRADRAPRQRLEPFGRQRGCGRLRFPLRRGGRLARPTERRKQQDQRRDEQPGGPYQGSTRKRIHDASLPVWRGAVRLTIRCHGYSVRRDTCVNPSAGR